MESLTLLATHPHGREQTTAALVATGLLTGFLVVVVVPLLLAPTGVLVSEATVAQVILGQLTASLMGAAAAGTPQQRPALVVRVVVVLVRTLVLEPPVQQISAAAAAVVVRATTAALVARAS